MDRKKYIDKNYLVKYRLLKESLETHERLNNITLSEDFYRELCNMDEKYLILFIIFTNKCSNFGRCSIVHNDTIDKLIEIDNLEAVKEEVMKGLDAVNELFDNNLLTLREENIIYQMLEVDYDTVYSIIYNYKDDLYHDKVLIGCHLCHDFRDYDRTLYDTYRETICQLRNIVSTKKYRGNIIYFVDINKYSESKYYRMKLDDVVRSIAERGTAFNIHTGKDMSSVAVKFISQRYSIEIKAYKYLLNTNYY